ncbi:MAG TPA: CotH kinase family protein, partial [candidate division Zixibacteria bacterium]|nr:CotH kinase family protein [candidate division Zixibacteria bacterium]
MLIKDSQRPVSIVEATSHVRRLLSRRWFAAVIVAALSLALFVGGMYFQRSGAVGPLVERARNLALSPGHLLRGALASPDRLTIDVAFDDFQKLAYKREQALQRGILITDEDSWVSAQIRFDERVMRCRIRLKGDLPDHLREDKWSFRINMRDDSTLYGMKRFSLHAPHTRNYIWEWVFQQTMKREGLIALRYRFVNVTVNGVDHGLYALEESFEKRLIEHNQRREGPIIKFNENVWWLESDGYIQDYALPGAGHFNSLAIDMFQSDRTVADTTLFAQFKVAHAALESFRAGESSVESVFDTEKLATYFALCDVLGAFHALNVIQYRFYFNPFTRKLEPIPFDANAGRGILELAALYKKEREYPWTGELRQLFIARAFAEPEFYKLYLQQLDRFSRPAYLDSLFSELDSALQENLSLIYSDEPGYHYSPDIVYNNQKFIRRFLEPVSALRAYVSRRGADSAYLQIAVTQQLPVAVERVTLNGETLHEFDPPVTLDGKRLTDPPRYDQLVVPLTSQSPAEGELRLHYTILGLSEEYDAVIAPWPAEDSATLSVAQTWRTSNVNEFEFLT